MRVIRITIGAITSAFMFAGCQSSEVSPMVEKSTGLSQVAISTRDIGVIESNGLQFRDLNRNGVVDPYENWRLSPAERANDLLKQMTLKEKVGQLAHGNIFPEGEFGAPARGYNMAFAKALILNQHITALIPSVSLNYQVLAEQNNAIQEIAEQSRLGIPVTMSTDPRHHFMTMIGASSAGEGYSKWPEPLGFAALDDEELTYRFAEVAAREYRATGFSQALSPQADLATEPRWARIHHTFGEDPKVAARMVGAYIRGFQGGKNGVRPGHVSAVVKHWVGYGAAKDGLDSHNYYGRFADLKEEDLPTHITPFQSAFDVQVSSVMPAYSIFQGLTVNGVEVEPRGAGYSEVLIDELLRRQYQYKGVVLSDWAITEDCSETCFKGASLGKFPDPMKDISTGWGVQDLSKPERFALAMQAGIDQFGGVMDVSPIMEAVKRGLIDEARIDQSVRRILEKTFATGLFETPFVDVESAKNFVNTAKTQQLALDTQSRSMVLLKRDKKAPLLTDLKQKLFLYNANALPFETAGYQIVRDMAKADVAIVRLSAPFENLHPGYFFGSHQHEGNLAFDPKGEQIKLLQSLKDVKARVIVDVSLDRPAVLTGIVDLADVLIVNFGASDLALLRALDGTVSPQGRLPFELPSSMEAVERQNSGKPADSDNPLFPLHYSADI